MLSTVPSSFLIYPSCICTAIWAFFLGSTGNAWPVRDYVPTISTDALHAAADRIKIIHEDITGRDEEFSQAKALLKNAERIYFLSFGYNATNMSRLGVTAISTTAQGTGLGLTDNERGQTMATVRGMISILPFDCIGLLRHTVQW